MRRDGDVVFTGRRDFPRSNKASSSANDSITQVLEKSNDIVSTNLWKFGHLPVLLQTESK